MSSPSLFQGLQVSRDDIDSLTPMDVQCRRDDRYFNLLYRNYNKNSINANRENSEAQNIPFMETDHRVNAFEVATPQNHAPCMASPEWSAIGPEFISRYHIYPTCLPLRRNAADIDRVRSRVGTWHEALPVQSYPHSPVQSPLCTSTPPACTPVKQSVSCLSTTAKSISLEQSLPCSSTTAESISVEQSLPCTSATPGNICAEQPLKDKKNTTPEPYKCPVCLKCVQQRQPTATTCGHVFCSSCIRVALRSTCKCPVCQSWITTRQTFRIYI